MLVRNYRCHPKLLDVPNRLFYDGKLLPFADIPTVSSLLDWEHLPAKMPLLFHGVIGKDVQEESSPSWFNVEEAVQVVKYVGLLLGNRGRIRVTEADIGIISPYHKQVQKIKQALKKLPSANSDAITVGSTEQFQGQERRIIIISTVRSNHNFLKVSSHVPLYVLGLAADNA